VWLAVDTLSAFGHIGADRRCAAIWELIEVGQRRRSALAARPTHTCAFFLRVGCIPSSVRYPSLFSLSFALRKCSRRPKTTDRPQKSPCILMSQLQTA
jgi:hypothetical protein